MNKVNIAQVNLWGMLVGAVLWNQDQEYGTFEFDKKFIAKGLDLAPLKMPLSNASHGIVFEFRNLSKDTFRGLPGMLADSLPDNFGNRIIDAWLAREGRTADFSPVERLCYTGKRGMGALEFEPSEYPDEQSIPVEVDELLKLAQEVTNERSELHKDLSKKPSEALLNIIRVGTSAGGNRPKAVIALNDQTNEIRSGQVEAPAGFDHWVLKFDGVQDELLGDPAGYGRIEFAYYKMATEAGIEMAECRLLQENGRAHFMTRRFDRPLNGGKLHLQTLSAIAHFDFHDPGAYSYEQAFQVMRELKLPYKDAEQQFRRMVFNVVARNQDDHTKNISFLMNKSGRWCLSPAYDMVYAYNPEGRWTNKHQMSLNGKRDNFTRDDLNAVGREMNIKLSNQIIDEITDVVSNWPGFAKEAGVARSQIAAIASVHRCLTMKIKY